MRAGVRVLLVGLAAVLAVAAGARPPTVAVAQQPPRSSPMDVRVTFDPPAVTLGERTRLTVAVLHDSELLVTVSEPGLTEGLLVVESLPPLTEPSGDELVTTFSFALAGFALGDLQLPALRVSWLDADGATQGVEVSVPALQVLSTLDPADLALRPLKPQALVGGAPPAWQRPAAAGAAVVALLGAAAWLAIRRRRRPPPDVPDVPLAVPEASARRQLNQLAAARLLDERDFERYYGTISLVVRGYIEQRFAFRATALTTTELQARMTDRGVERWQARLVGGLLDRCDAAVYASRRPDPASADHDLTVAFEIIELTQPPSLVSPA